MGVNAKEILEKLKAMGVTDVSESDINEFIDAGLDEQSIIEMFAPGDTLPDSSGDKTDNKIEMPKPVKSLPKPEPGEFKPPVVGVDSKTKKVIQKHVSASAQDAISKILSQVPPQAKARIYRWDEENLQWGYIATVPADVFTEISVQDFIKKKYVRKYGGGKYKIELYDAAGNFLTSSETLVYGDEVSTSGAMPYIPEGEDNVELIAMVKNMFETMNKEKDKVYQEMLKLQQQLAQEKVESAKQTMELLQEQIRMLEQTYLSRLQEVQQYAGGNSQADMLIAELRRQMESQIQELKQFVYDVATKLNQAEKKDDTKSLITILMPIITKFVENMNKEDDSFKKMMEMMAFIDKLKGDKELSQAEQFKMMMEIIKATKEDKIDPMQQFSTVLSVVKEMMPKEDSTSKLKDFLAIMAQFMPKQKDTFEELQKLKAVMELLGVNKNDDKDRILYEIIRDMKESQQAMFQRFQMEQDGIKEIIRSITESQQQQMYQMMEGFKQTMEMFVRQMQAQQSMKRLEVEPEVRRDPIDKLLEDMQKLEQLKRIMGGGSSSGGGGFLSKLGDALAGVLPMLLAQAQQQPALPPAPQYGYMPSVPQKRVVRRRRAVVRPKTNVNRLAHRRPAQPVPPPPPTPLKKQSSAIPAPAKQPVGAQPQPPAQQETPVQAQAEKKILRFPNDPFEKGNLPPDVAQNIAQIKDSYRENNAKMIASYIEASLAQNPNESPETIFNSYVTEIEKAGLSSEDAIFTTIACFDSKDDFKNAIKELMDKNTLDKNADKIDGILDAFVEGINDIKVKSLGGGQ